MRTSNVIAVLAAVAATAATVRDPILRNVASIRTIRAAGAALERPPIDRFTGAALIPGDAEWQSKNTAQARAAWQAAGDFRRLVAAGRYLERTGEPDAAESMYSAAAAVPAADESGALALAALRWNRGNRDGAARAYEALFAKDPKRGGDLAYSNLATLYAEQRRFPEADATLKRGMSFWPQSVPLRTTSGMVYALSGRNELAASTLSRVWTEHPDAAGACYWLGWTRERQGDDRAAARQFSACIARNPGDVSSRYELGVTSMRIGDFAAARAAFVAIPSDAPLHRAASDRLRQMDAAR